jgi:hypothetical protein
MIREEIALEIKRVFHIWQKLLFGAFFSTINIVFKEIRAEKHGGIHVKRLKNLSSITIIISSSTIH